MQTKINAEVMKRVNRDRILGLIRKKAVSRAEIARETGLTRAAVSFIVDGLLSEGRITEGKTVESGGGRPAVLLHIDPKFGTAFGISILRNFYKVGLCDYAGKVLKEEEGVVCPENAEKTLADIAEKMEKMLSAAKNPVGIGIVAPGPLDKSRGTLGEVTNFPDWKNRDICTFFRERFGIFTVLDNISNALSRAEFLENPQCGDRYLELIVDSGFGSSLCDRTDGTVKITECELGHTTVKTDGARCGCGNIGCAELYVNEENYFRSEKTQAEFFSALASVICNAENAFSVKTVVLYGFMNDGFKEFSARLAGEIEDRRRNIRLLPSALRGKDVFVACQLIF